MITIIFGAPGVGKSALNTYFLKQTYRTRGRAMLEYTTARILAQNTVRKIPLTVPEKAPIFANYRIKFKIGYEKWYEPYYVNGFYLGLDHENIPTQHLPPGSKVYLSEVQRYYNSRKSQSFPDWVSRWYEMHRHGGFDVTMDCQRPELIDVNIRALCKHFIEVRSMEHVTDFSGKIKRTVFRCFEFDDWLSVETYQKSGAKTYREVSYENVGDIFDCFDSYSYFEEFLPDERADFNYLKFVSRSEQRGLPQEQKKFYKTDEPDWFRGKKKEGKTA